MFLSPEDPPRLYYEFEVNPLGTLFDARVVVARSRARDDARRDRLGLRGIRRAGDARARALVGEPADPPRTALRRAVRRRPGARTSTGSIAAPWTSTRRGRRPWRSRPTSTCRAGSGRCGFRSRRLGVRPLHDPLPRQPLHRALPRPPLLVLEEVRLLLRMAQERRAVRRRRIPGGEGGLEVAPAGGVLAVRGEVLEVPARALAARRAAARRSADPPESAAWRVGVLDQDLDDVAGLPVVRNA